MIRITFEICALLFCRRRRPDCHSILHRLTVGRYTFEWFIFFSLLFSFEKISQFVLLLSAVRLGEIEYGKEEDKLIMIYKRACVLLLYAPIYKTLIYSMWCWTMKRINKDILRSLSFFFVSSSSSSTLNSQYLGEAMVFFVLLWS